MRTLLAWGLLAALALPARADIVDSGSLIIGGQGIIGGTFTVQGNAMSVAGSVSATSATLSGTGNNVFSLTTSSGIHLVNGVLRWPDGSTSTTASSGGGGSGNAVLAGTQTWTGSNTFAGSIYTSTMTGIVGGAVLVASASVSGVATVTFSNLAAYPYEVRWNFAQNSTSGSHYLEFNGQNNVCRNMPIAIANNGWSYADNGSTLFYLTSGAVEQGYFSQGRAQCDIQPGANTVNCYADLNFRASDTRLNRGIPIASCAISAPLSQIVIGTSGGTVTGYVGVYRRLD